MKLTAILVLLTVPVTEALFWDLLAPLWNRIAGRICDEAIVQLGIDDQVDCQCSGDFAIRPFGVSAAADCQTKGTICLNATGVLCGSAEVEADLGVGDGFVGEVKVTLEIQPELGLPEEIEDLLKTTLSISGKADNEFALSECTAALGPEAEDECGCEPCAEGLGIDIDCSAVNISPTPNVFFFPGPDPGCLDLALAEVLTQ